MEKIKLFVVGRYTIVLQIFKEHARTKEAKLQVALAEIPYIRCVLSLLGLRVNIITSCYFSLKQIY